MNIKTILFANDQDPAFYRIESVISSAVNSLTGRDDGEPASYTDIYSGLTDIASSLKTNDIIMIFADEKMYHDVKRYVCKAFKFEMVRNEAVLKKLSSLQNNERYAVHSLAPKNATPFPLADGLFPGFAIRSKHQCLFFIPFSQDRTFITMKKYVFPYIGKVYGIKTPNFNEFEIAYAAVVLEEQLENAGENIAVANTPFCKYIAHAGKKIEYFNDYISYAPYNEKNKDVSVRKNAAVKAAEYYEYRFGASVTEDENDMYGKWSATITIANEKSATIRNLSSIEDETHEDFMCTVVTEFFLMLAEVLENSPELSEEERKALKPSAAIHGWRIVLYVVLFAAAFFLTYMAASSGNSAPI